MQKQMVHLEEKKREASFAKRTKKRKKIAKKHELKMFFCKRKKNKKCKKNRILSKKDIFCIWTISLRRSKYW
jgi:hypothetical protein